MESYPILRDYKIKFLRDLLCEAVDRKYKISFHKGMQFAFEALIVLVLMVSIVLKSNILSIIYLLFVFKYIQCRSKVQLLVHLAGTMSITIVAQYLLLVINLTHHVSPSPYPSQFSSYPLSEGGGKLNIKYLFPYFYNIEIFKDLRLTYLVGVTIERQQVQNLFLDFLNLFLISIYIYHYRNPVMRRSVEKIRWCMPTKLDPVEKWGKLDEKVRVQLKWLSDPMPIEHGVYKNIKAKFSKNQLQVAKEQFEFAQEYNKLGQQDLNQILVEYVDLSYNQIWSNDFCCKIKKQFKQQSFYYRVVKQGSILVYITFHIITIFMILLAATLRQSIISFLYILIIIPKIKDLSNVLIQRDIHLDAEKQELKLRQNELVKLLESYQEQISKSPNDPFLRSKIVELKKELVEVSEQILKIQDKQLSKTFEQKQDEKVLAKQGQWAILQFIQKDLIRLAIIDFCLQILVQMPLIKHHPFMETLGLRKVWVLDDENDLVFKNLLKDGHEGYHLNFYNFLVQCMNCVIICFISIQIEIFQSSGFKKFVTQKNGSMDLLVSIAAIKAKSISYVYNNKKIRKIISIQRRKETILATVEKLKLKLKRWRIFTRTTLNIDDDEKQKVQTLEIMKQLDNPKLQRSNTKTKAKDALNPLLKKAQFETTKKHHEPHEHQHTHVRIRNKKVTQEEASLIFDQLAKEFVLAKKKKLNVISKFYLFLHEYFVEQIMFKNNPIVLKEYVTQHAQGEIFTPSELEQLMLDEAMELIQNQYDHKEGAYELYNLFKQKKHKNLLSLTNFDKKIKLKQMRRTWSFTRYGSMSLKLVETFFYILISNSQNMIYLSMILSMYCNAGLISIVYPILVFGYAMMEETRPRKEFWTNIRAYTQFLLVLKFLANLSIFGEVMDSQQFLNLQGYLKIGIYDYDTLGEIFMYMLPEILIIIFVMLNEIQLKLIGMYYMLEQDHESINDAIQRNILKGDAEKVKQNKIIKANMQLCRFFSSIDCQTSLEMQIIQEEKEKQKQKDDKHSSSESSCDEDFRPTLKDLNKDQQTILLKEISGQLFKSSRQFDIDMQSNTKKSNFDNLISENVIQKSLENDNMIYVEGHQSQNLDFQELRQDIEDEVCEVISAGDYPEEFSEKIKDLNDNKQPQLSYFEKNHYFESLFPSLKIQKPGYDLYGSTTIIQSILAIYVFLYYGQISVDQVQFIDSIKNNNSIFKGEMALILIIIILTIVIERYVNRSDTKAVQVKGLSQSEEKISFFKQEEMFVRTNTQKNMTVQLNTMKTTDLDMQGTSAQDFLQTMYGDGQDENDYFDDTRTKITTQQKTKFVLHWILLIASHILVFWYIPITGNIQLYGKPQCDLQQKDRYGCKNFHDNWHLKVFYLLLCIYFALSAHQLKYGFTIMRKPSSVMQYNDDPLALLGAQVYMGIPFATEIRCLLDFTFNKTSLDIFQFWQLFQYHIELYIAKNGNIYYQHKVLGSPTGGVDKCVFGVFISTIILTMLIGPIFFFSDLGGFITSNPVSSGEIKLALIVNKNNSFEEIIANEAQRAELNLAEFSNIDNDAFDMHSENSYFIYENQFPFLRQYDDEYYSQKSFHNWTETRFFKSDQLQDCIANEYSDHSWDVSERAQFQLKQDLLKAVDPTNHRYDVKLGIYYEFERELPAEAKKASGQQIKTLNSSNLYDCHTMEQIKKLVELDCKTPTPGYRNNVTIRFSQAYIPNLVLGSNKKIAEVVREGVNISHENQKHDILLEYHCGNQWTVHASKDPTVINPEDLPYLEVDSETCGPLLHKKTSFEDDVIWFRVTFTLFSMMVSASIFASFNVTTFYTGVVLVLGSQVRPIFLFGTWKGFIYETTHPDAIIKLIEACYMKRHEEDLIGEEEAYRMLQEIVRSPELLKAITGSCLKGSCDPHLDRLTAEDRAKLQHLDLLERKGFEVSKLKQQIRQQKKADDDYNF